jgi:signal transduction histidine kinase
MGGLGLSERAALVLSDLEGKVLLGSLDHPPELRTVTEFFAGNFPPWKMEFYKTKAADLEMRSLRNSFYFWTVLTLVVILTFGTVLIIRTIAQELDILRLKSDFVSSVSHEFKTPLTSMKALLERLEDDKVQDRDRMKQYFSLLSQSADRLIRLVKNLLDFSKIEEGRKEYNLAPTDISELVAQEVSDFKREELHTGIEIRSKIANDLPLLMADRESLAQAVHNLLDNAVKFSPERKGIEVSVRKEEGSIIIEVADQGIGIPQDEVERIFEKFYQGQNAVRQVAKGTGLGLTLVKHTVEAHGGKVLVRSRVGEGSTFSLVFPIKKK